jgi:hypothetical protein
MQMLIEPVHHLHPTDPLEILYDPQLVATPQGFSYTSGVGRPVPGAKACAPVLLSLEHLHHYLIITMYCKALDIEGETTSRPHTAHFLLHNIFYSKTGSYKKA